MNKMKCTDCGHVFDSGLEECPNCGCPANICDNYTENVNASNQDYGIPTSIKTTDTGYANEKAIKTYANYIFYITIGICMLALIITIFALFTITGDSYLDSGYKLLILLRIIIICAIFIILTYVFRAFICVIHNISINLHEINMKTK